MLFNGLERRNSGAAGNWLVTRRQGELSFLNQWQKGEKRIPYSSICAVQFKDAGFTTGYTHFGVTGSIETRGGVFNANTDENTVPF